MSWAAGFAISNNFHRPEGLIIKRIVPKPVSVVIAIILGAIRALIFILTTACATLIFTAQALYRVVKGQPAAPHAVAALLNLLGCAVGVGFLALSAFYLSFHVASGLFITAIAVSIIFHVVKACKE